MKMPENGWELTNGEGFIKIDFSKKLKYTKFHVIMRDTVYAVRKSVEAIYRGIYKIPWCTHAGNWKTLAKLLMSNML